MLGETARGSVLIVQFEISHDFDASVDELERALLSPELGPRLGRALPNVESIESRRHELRDGELARVWRFQARAPLPIFRSRKITRDMLTWEEEWTYQRRDRSARWNVVPRPGIDPDAPWRRRFRAHGQTQLTALSDARTRRTIRGDLGIELRWIGGVVERLAVAELRKAYAAEAQILEVLCNEALGKDAPCKAMECDGPGDSQAQGEARC